MTPTRSAGKHRDPDFTGAVVLVTGGGHGIGATIATRFARAGADVSLVGRDQHALSEAQGQIAELGGGCLALQADVTAEDEVRSAVAQTVTEFGSLSILVNNAGISGPAKALADLQLDEWESVLKINLTGAFLCCREAIPHLRRAGGGRILNIGSGTGKRPLVNRTPYATSKLGLVGLTRTLAQELGGDEITVNTISPYVVEGPRMERVLSAMSAERGITAEEVRAELVAGSPFRRGVSEEDVAGVALFLASEAASNLTGQDYNVSAGSVFY
jgi:NAD(P)-dependent dehydrogenase (short-subunit alcohol dehydrogenase family)